MQRIIAFTEDELADLLIKSANLGASQAIRSAQPKEVMTKKEVADYLRVSVATVDRKMKDGLPFVKVSEDSPRFYRRQVDNWLHERL